MVVTVETSHLHGAPGRGVASAQALHRPRAALQVIAAHLPSDHAGLCVNCGETAPCAQLDPGYIGLLRTNVVQRREPAALLHSRPTFNGFAEPI